MRIPILSSVHLRDLRALGLHVEQIEELQKHLLHIKMYLEPFSTVTDIRARWRTVGKPLGVARRELVRMMESKLADAMEAKFRLVDVAEDPDLIQSALKAIAAVEAAIGAASVKLPTQRRNHSASSLPIGIIDRALLRGFTRHFPSPMPPYLLSASRSGVFAKVVSICYQAVGRDADPDRAIRNYVKEVSLRNLFSRKKAFTPLFGSAFNLGDDFLETKKPGRPRRAKRSP
ncbi:MAG TPA: hypothetical protein VK629_04385 [Steroidobacteraceae bacterium]|nr:hypothetical protein [Steroidobacteraceae bacterium]